MHSVDLSPAVCMGAAPAYRYRGSVRNTESWSSCLKGSMTSAGETEHGWLVQSGVVVLEGGVCIEDADAEAVRGTSISEISLPHRFHDDRMDDGDVLSNPCRLLMSVDARARCEGCSMSRDENTSESSRGELSSSLMIWR